MNKAEADKEIVLYGNALLAKFEYPDAAELDRKIAQGAAHSMHYHDDWEHLMPVCKKFDTLWESEEIRGDANEKYTALCDALDARVTLYEPRKIFDHLVNCVEWYNQFQIQKLKGIEVRPTDPRAQVYGIYFAHFSNVLGLLMEHVADLAENNDIEWQLKPYMTGETALPHSMYITIEDLQTDIMLGKEELEEIVLYIRANL